MMMTMTMMKILIKGILQTPSKVLRDVTNKPKIQFQTPAKQNY